MMFVMRGANVSGCVVKCIWDVIIWFLLITNSLILIETIPMPWSFHTLLLKPPHAAKIIMDGVFVTPSFANKSSHNTIVWLSHNKITSQNNFFHYFQKLTFNCLTSQWGWHCSLDPTYDEWINIRLLIFSSL